MADAQASSGPPLWRRIALTLGLSLLPLLGERVPLPGIDTDAELFQHGDPRLHSVFALGISPLVSAYLTVEVAALLVPRWRKLRHAFPDGRAKLRRATTLLAIVLAAFQAMGVVIMMSASEAAGVGTSAPERMLPGLSLVLGSALLMFVAKKIDEQGLVIGVLALQLVSAANESASKLAAAKLPTAELAWLHAGLAVSLPVLATCLAASMTRRNLSRTGAGFSIPAGSIEVVALASTLLLTPPPFLMVNPDITEWLTAFFAGPHRFELTLGAATLVTFVFGFVLQQPRDVAHVWRSIDDEATDATLSTATRALTYAHVPTLLFIVTLLAADELGYLSRLPLPSAAALAIGTAVILDLVQALVFHARHRGWVRVWQERRPYALPALVSVAAREGLTLQGTGLVQTALLRLFGPYAAISVWCAPAEAEHARSLLGELLGYANEPPSADAKPVDDAEPTAAAAAPNPKPPWASARTWALLGTCATALALTFAARAAARGRAVSQATHVKFDLVLIDDEFDAFGINMKALSPPGVTINQEDAPGGERSRRISRHYVVLTPEPGESLERATERIAPWLETIQLPAGERFAWQVHQHFDEAGTEPHFDGWRSYVLKGPSIVTTRDVTNAKVNEDDSGGVAVGLRFSADGAERFRVATRENIHRRIALMLDGKVNTTPEVRSEIRGGNLEITLGSGDPKRVRAEAEALVQALTGSK
jgi:hypothetical protein